MLEINMHRLLDWSVHIDSRHEPVSVVLGIYKVL